MNVRTFVFGNPSGWTLYEGDLAENDYFKSFYVIKRRGDRLMVNRRSDGRVVYTYINYDLCESSNRCGAAHFGIAIMLDGGSYTPEFDTMYRFMRDAFQTLLSRSDSPFTPHGDRMRYTISKLTDAESPIEWIKSILPRIFEKVEIRTLDPRIGQGNVGRVETLCDTTSRADMNAAFERSSWIAISPQFALKSAVNDSKAQSEVEISLRDLDIQNKEMTKVMLAMALGQTSVTREAIEELVAKKDYSRILLADYIKSDPGENEEKEARRIQTEYSQMQSQIEALEAKLISSQNHSDGIDNDRKKENQRYSGDHSVDYGINKNHRSYEYIDSKDTGDKHKITLTKQTHDTPRYMWIVGGTLILLLAGFSIFAGLKSCSGGPTDSEPDNSDSFVVIGENIEEVEDSQELEKKKREVIGTLWAFAKTDDAETNIKNFFNSESESLEKLGFTEPDNGLTQWLAIATLWKEAQTIWNGKDWYGDGLRYNEYINIIERLPASDDEKQDLLVQAKIRHQGILDKSKTKIPIKKEAGKTIKTGGGFDSESHEPINTITVKVNGETKTHKAPGFTVRVNHPIQIICNEPLSTTITGASSVQSSPDRKSLTVTISSPGAHTLNTADGKHTITLTAN